MLLFGEMGQEFYLYCRPRNVGSATSAGEEPFGATAWIAGSFY